MGRARKGKGTTTWPEGVETDSDYTYLPTYLPALKQLNYSPVTYAPNYFIIIIKRRSGINPIPPTVIDRD